jgi:hypothetical protein
MRRLVIKALLALVLTLVLTVGSARIASSTAHIPGHAHSMIADVCSGSQAPC